MARIGLIGLGLRLGIEIVVEAEADSSRFGRRRVAPVALPLTHFNALSAAPKLM